MSGRWTRWSAALVALAFGTLAASTARADILGDLAQQLQGALSGDSLLVILSVMFLAGLVTSLTPCVYPMIGITVAVFGAKQAKSRGQAALLALVFVHGMSALLVPMGVSAAMAGGLFGDALNSPWVLAFLFVLLMAMGASLFGAFNLSLPTSWQTKLAQMGGSGYRGAFLVGFALGLVAAPCTGPVLGVLLPWIANTQNPALGALALYVYSLGLGLLFFVVATFAASLPKSGRWLEWIKSTLGVLMVFLAFYFVRSYIDIFPVQRTPAWIALGAGAAAIGLLIGAVHLSFHDSPVKRARKFSGIVLSVGGFFAISTWLHALPAGATIEWVEDLDAAHDRADENNLPMLVDFGADWCTACTELEHEAMSDPRVVLESRRFVTLRVDMSADKVTPEKRELLRSYNHNGLPLVVMHCPNGNEAHRITGLVTANEFLEKMQETLEGSPACAEDTRTASLE